MRWHKLDAPLVCCDLLTSSLADAQSKVDCTSHKPRPTLMEMRPRPSEEESLLVGVSVPWVFLLLLLLPRVFHLLLRLVLEEH